MNLFKAKRHEWYLGIEPMFAFGVVCSFQQIAVLFGPIAFELEWW